MSKYLYYKAQGHQAGLQAAWDEFWDKVDALHQHANNMAKALGHMILKDGAINMIAAVRRECTLREVKP